MSTQTQNKKLLDKEIITMLVKELRVSFNRMAEDCSYTSHASIYHVKNGLNNISEDMRLRIIKAYPEVRYQFLKYGEEPILDHNKGKAQLQQNLLQLGEDKPTFISKLETLLNNQTLHNHQILGQLIEINKKLDSIVDNLKK